MRRCNGFGEHPKDGFQEPPFGHYPTALANFQWDVLSLQPFDRHLDGKDGDIVMAKNFIDLGPAQESRSSNLRLRPLAEAGEGRFRHGLAEEVHGRLGQYERNEGLFRAADPGTAESLSEAENQSWSLSATSCTNSING